MVVVEQVVVVLQPDEGRRRVGRRTKIGERVSERVDQRKDVEDDQERNRGDDEQIAYAEVAETAPRGQRARIESAKHLRPPPARALPGASCNCRIVMVNAGPAATATLPCW